MSARMDDIELEVGHLTHLILVLNALIDTGEYVDVTVDEVEKRIDDGTIVPYMQELFAEAQILRPSLDATAASEITAALQSLLDAYGGRERRKWAVENGGLNLLLAWINEMIQQGVRQETIRLPWSRR